MDATPTLKVPFMTEDDSAYRMAEITELIARWLEGKVLDGSLKGSKGDRGLPGTNGVATDTAVATYAGEEGTATRAALDSLFNQWSYWINVKDHGALGDGVTDDGAAIQAAINAAAATGATIVFPPGTYPVAGQIVLRSNLTLQGMGGATLLKTAGYNLFVGLAKTATGYGSGINNLTVRDLTFRGDLSKPQSCNPFYLHRAKNVRILDCNFIECIRSGHCVDLGGCEDVLIAGCIFAGALNTTGREYVEAIQLDCSTAFGWGGGDTYKSGETFDGIATRKVTVRDCKFIKWGSYAAPSAFGSHTAVAGRAYTDLLFTGNYLEGQAQPQSFSGYYGQIHFIQAQRVKITDNTFRAGSEPQVAMRFWRGASAIPIDQVGSNSPSLSDPATKTPPQDIEISGNSFIGYNHDQTSQSVIEIFGYDETNPARQLTLSRNRFLGNNTPGPAAVTIYYAVGAALTGNSVTGFQQGFYLRGGQRCTVTGNSLTGSTGGNVGVNLTQGHTKSVVVANTISGFTTAVGQYSGATGNAVANNAS